MNRARLPRPVARQPPALGAVARAAGPAARVPFRAAGRQRRRQRRGSRRWTSRRSFRRRRPSGSSGPRSTSLMGLRSRCGRRAAWARGRRAAILAFVVQLALNLAWSPVFFGVHEISAARWRADRAPRRRGDARRSCCSGACAARRRCCCCPIWPGSLFATLLNWQFLQANPDARPIGAVQLECRGLRAARPRPCSAPCKAKTP